MLLNLLILSLHLELFLHQTSQVDQHILNDTSILNILCFLHLFESFEELENLAALSNAVLHYSSIVWRLFLVLAWTYWGPVVVVPYCVQSPRVKLCSGYFC